MKTADWTLRDNIRALLNKTGKQAKDVCDWCGHEKSWLPKFLSGGRGIQISELGKIADFFHIEVYQLFTPGIAGAPDRRRGFDRRSNIERRLSDDEKSMIKLRSRLPQTHRGHPDAPDSAVDSENIRQRLANITQQIERLSREAATLSVSVQSRRQTTNFGRKGPAHADARGSERRRDA